MLVTKGEKVFQAHANLFPKKMYFLNVLHMMSSIHRSKCYSNFVPYTVIHTVYYLLPEGEIMKDRTLKFKKMYCYIDLHSVYYARTDQKGSMTKRDILTRG